MKQAEPTAHAFTRAMQQTTAALGYAGAAFARASQRTQATLQQGTLPSLQLQRVARLFGNSRPPSSPAANGQNASTNGQESPRPASASAKGAPQSGPLPTTPLGVFLRAVLAPAGQKASALESLPHAHSLGRQPVDRPSVDSSPVKRPPVERPFGAKQSGTEQVGTRHAGYRPAALPFSPLSLLTLLSGSGLSNPSFATPASRQRPFSFEALLQGVEKAQARAGGMLTHMAHAAQGAQAANIMPSLGTGAGQTTSEQGEGGPLPPTRSGAARHARKRGQRAFRGTSREAGQSLGFSPAAAGYGSDGSNSIGRSGAGYEYADGPSCARSFQNRYSQNRCFQDRYFRGNALSGAPFTAGLADAKRGGTGYANHAPSAKHHALFYGPSSAQSMAGHPSYSASHFLQASTPTGALGAAAQRELAAQRTPLQALAAPNVALQALATPNTALQALDAQNPLLPSATPPARTEFNIGSITISTQATDAQGIMRDAFSAVKKEALNLQQLTHAVNTGVNRS